MEVVYLSGERYQVDSELILYNHGKVNVNVNSVVILNKQSPNKAQTKPKQVNTHLAHK